MFWMLWDTKVMDIQMGLEHVVVLTSGGEASHGKPDDLISPDD